MLIYSTLNVVPRADNANFESVFTVQGTLKFLSMTNNVYKDILEDNNISNVAEKCQQKKIPLYINSVLSRQNRQPMPVRFQPASANHVYCLGQLQNQHSGQCLRLSTLPSTKLVN